MSPGVAFAAIAAAALAACSLIETYPELTPDPHGGAGGATTSSSEGGGAPTSTGVSGACTPMATRACYSGPAGTEGVGSCAGGLETCLPDGSGYGPCEGEMVPVPEDCATPEDEDCDNVGKCGGEVLWSLFAGDSEAQEGLSVACDGAGDVWVTGAASGGIDLGGGPLPYTVNPAIVLAKLSASGAHVHSAIFPGGAGRAITADGQGNAIVAAQCSGDIDFGGGVLPGGSSADVCVVKFNTAGSFVWAKRFPAALEQVPRGIATDEAGNIAVIGSFQGGINFGGGALASAGGRDIFAAMLSAAGDHVWSASFGGTLDQIATAVAIDTSGLVLVGTAAGAVDFGGGPLQPAGNDDIVVAKLDLAGAHVWSQRYGSISADQGLAVAIDDAGSVLVTGTFQGVSDFDGMTLIAAGGEDMFLRKMTPGGANVFTRRFGDGQNQAGLGIAVDPAGAILLTGRFSGAIDFGSGLLQSAGSNDMFLAQLGPAGEPLWSRRFGGASDEVAPAMVRSAQGPVFVTGSFDGDVDFGGGLHSSAGSRDLFVLAFAP